MRNTESAAAPPVDHRSCLLFMGRVLPPERDLRCDLGVGPWGRGSDGRLARETGRGAIAPGSGRGRLSRGTRESGTRIVSLLLRLLSPIFDYHVCLVQVVGDREDREDSRHKAGEGRG